MYTLIAQCDTTNGLSADCLNHIEDKAIFTKGFPAGFTEPRSIISAIIPYMFTFGGLILFIMLIWGGFEMLSGAANPKAQEAGKQRITNALIGFILLFSSYWIAQIVQAVFGISILGTIPNTP